MQRKFLRRADFSPEILPRRGIRDLGARSALGPFHDDLAADNRHDRPTGDIPALVNRPGSYGVEKLFGDRCAPFRSTTIKSASAPGRIAPFFG